MTINVTWIYYIYIFNYSYFKYNNHICLAINSNETGRVREQKSEIQDNDVDYDYLPPPHTHTPTLPLSLPSSPLMGGALRSSSPLPIRSVALSTRDFRQLLRRNEMICPGAAAKCWMDTYSWDGYRSQS